MPTQTLVIRRSHPCGVKHPNGIMDGQCCCNCARQKPVMHHPCSTGKPITKKTGLFVCTLLDNPMLNTPHGVCEGWEQRTDQLEG